MLCSSLKKFFHNWLSIKSCFYALEPLCCSSSSPSPSPSTASAWCCRTHQCCRYCCCACVRVCVYKCVFSVFACHFLWQNTWHVVYLHPLFVFSSCLLVVPPYSSSAFVPCPPIGWTVCLFAIGLVLRLQNCNRCLSALAINCSASSEVALSCEWQVNGEVNKCEYIKCSSRTVPALTGWNRVWLFGFFRFFAGRDTDLCKLSLCVW